MFPEDYNEEILNFLDKWREDIVKVGQVLGGCQDISERCLGSHLDGTQMSPCHHFWYLDTSWTQALFLCTEHIVITHIILLFCCIIEDLTKYALN